MKAKTTHFAKSLLMLSSTQSVYTYSDGQTSKHFLAHLLEYTSNDLIWGNGAGLRKYLGAQGPRVYRRPCIDHTPHALAAEGQASTPPLALQTLLDPIRGMLEKISFEVENV